MIERTFRNLSDEEVADIEKASFLARIGWSGSVGWDVLLQSQRILIVSEAGAGKTFECQQQQKRLWIAGQPAFFLDLATLSASSVREMLSYEEEERLDAWQRSQSEVATFFLDSIDELKLTLGNFGQALTRLNKAIAGHLGRTRIVITTRPVPVDQQLIKRHLPLPAALEAEASAEAFADVVMDRKKRSPSDKSKVSEWRNVGLMPLSREQMRAFALAQHVADPDALLDNIRLRDAEEFAERPQDLIEICSDWREHQHIRTHREQVETNIATKLKPRTERKEQAQLSQEKAIDGASRIALAALLTRKLTVRYSADSDSVPASEAALDASKILIDWDAPALATLLEKPLFGFASYGRVRFHHRSVLEYLAAKRLEALLARGIAIKAIKRLLFAETAQGNRVVRPSMRPVAAWLALWRETIFDDIVAIDPAVVLDHGDPQSLRPAQRTHALEAYVSLNGAGGWRGLKTPSIQVHRFASAELSEPINHLWRSGIENPEVRDLLLEIIGAGKLTACADIAHDVAMNTACSVREREAAIDALMRLDDARLERLASSIESDPATWPDAIARPATVALFPRFLSVSRLSNILKRVRENPRAIGDLGYHLPRAIETAELPSSYLNDLRQALTALIVEDLRWDTEKYPHFRTKRPDLMQAFISACHRQCRQGIRTEDWTTSCLLAIRLFGGEHSFDAAKNDLQRALADLPSGDREIAFWKEDAFLQSVHPHTDIWHRVYEAADRSGLRLTAEKDATWIRKCLADKNASLEQREMMLWVEMTALMQGAKSSLNELRPFVADAPRLAQIIDNRLKPSKTDEDIKRMEARRVADRTKYEKRDAKAHASWVEFWREIVNEPDKAFDPKKAQNTAWNLWQAMERSGSESRASGWNRRFVEAQFGKEVADRLRVAMCAAWRNDRPTLRSERSAEEKGRFLVRWQFGLAAIAAEAEDANWATSLTEAEAALACRYAPLELNGFPSWLDSLVAIHPAAVDRVLGRELDLSLREPGDAQSYSMQLQNVRYATPAVAALFVPRVREWVKDVSTVGSQSDRIPPERNLSQAVEILTVHGGSGDRQFLATTAIQRLNAGLAVPFSAIWMPVLLQINATAGVDVLEKGLRDRAVSSNGDGVRWFARLFGRDHGNTGVNPTGPGFTPQLLLRLIRLAYAHVRIAEDAHHEASYTPDTRDNAERGRDAVLSALLATTGSEGWAAKLELAHDPLLAHFKDRAIALAQEKAAEEADSAAMNEAEFVTLDSKGEAPPATREEIFTLMRDRLDDIDDLLLQDISPREAWAGISEERVMRRELARELRNRANDIYTVDQEAATADEKETDIRLRAISGQQAIIELKIGEKPRSAAELKTTLKEQLVVKYMAAEECRAGCLVITVSSSRHWNHPDTNERLDLSGLIAFLNEEADRLSCELGGAIKLFAKGIDLQPRLPTEREARSLNSKSARQFAPFPWRFRTNRLCCIHKHASSALFAICMTFSPRFCGIFCEELPMTRELYWLTLTVILTGIMWLPYVLNRIMVRGVGGAMANPTRNDKSQAEWANRMMFAHDNAVENLIIFAPLVIILNLADVSTPTTVLACAVYFWSRVAHLIVYTLGLPIFRTLAFVVGFAAQAVLAVAILRIPV